MHDVRPGLIDTDTAASSGSMIANEGIAEGCVPVLRWGQKVDVGQAVATLTAARLPYMTGQPVWVAGGLNIAPAP